MAGEIRQDVSTKVGLIYIGLCALIGCLIGGILPAVADGLGYLYLGKTPTGFHHIGLGEILFFGVVASFFGAFNSVLLAVNPARWLVSLAISTVPCGLFGGIISWTATRSVSRITDFVVFIVVPISVTAVSVQLRRVIWSRYQKLVIQRSK